MLHFPVADPIGCFEQTLNGGRQSGLVVLDHQGVITVLANHPGGHGVLAAGMSLAQGLGSSII
jgi:hypothetical protein